VSYREDGIEQLNTEELLSLYDQKPDDVTFVDVREPDEYAAGHIPGILLIPTSEFVDRYEQKLKDKEHTYVMVCRSGSRSQMVCQFMQSRGYTRCLNYADGMLGWNGPEETGDK
jgi:rhodanese-related sulfurtransferase